MDRTQVMYRFFSNLALVIVLTLLWPTGLPSSFRDEAVQMQIPEPVISAYEGASPASGLPTAVLIWLFVFCGAAYSTRRSGLELKNRPMDIVREFGVCWALVGVLQWFFGAPFVTGDSGVYLRAALHPWLQFGSHHPSGPSWFLWFGRQLGLPVSATVAAIAACEIVVLKRMFSYLAGSAWGWFVAALFFWHPDLLTIRLSLWSEPGMLLLIALTSLVLCQRRLFANRHWATYLGLGLLFVVMCEMRHAAIFLLPGLAAAMALATTPRRTYFPLLARFGCAMVWLVLLWATLNVARTGNPLRPSAASFECVQYVAAYHRVPFCSTAPAIPLCLADPQGEWLKQENGVEPDFVSLDRFIFRPESPLHSFLNSSEAACDLWGGIKKELMANHKMELLRLVASRLVAQFGRWEISERGQGIQQPYFLAAQEWFDSAAHITQRYLWLVWVMWALALIRGVVTGRLFEPVVAFLILAACGHALGIALNNPFLALRYTAVPKYLMSCAAALMLIPRRRAAHYQPEDHAE